MRECLVEVELVAVIDDLVLVSLFAVLGVDFMLENFEVLIRRKLTEGCEALIIQEVVVCVCVTRESELPPLQHHHGVCVRMYVQVRA